MSDQPPWPRFVGRHEERERLRDALEKAARGQPRMVVIGGEAGVGKTHLVEQFVATASDTGAHVLLGACVELGAEELPLAPVISALRGLARRMGEDAFAGPPYDGGGLARLVPELGAGEPAQEIRTQARLFRQVHAFLDRLGRDRPVLLVVEDLHWADRSTCDLLGMLVRDPGDARLLIVVTFRTEDLRRGHPLRPFLAELERVRRVQRIDLDRFSKAETGELVAGALGARPAAALVDRVFRRSGGNAFFAEELARAEAEADPRIGASLRDLLLGRIERLPDTAQHVVGVAAVGGQWISHRLLAAVTDPDEPALLGALRAAVDAAVIVFDGEGYAFRHELVREAAVERLLPGERMRLHRAFAEVLETCPHLVPPDRAAAEVAHHWSHAREPAKAVPALLRAADAAKAMHAYAEQSTMLVRVLSLWPEAACPGVEHLDVLEEAAAAAWHAGRERQALDLVDRALAEAGAAGRTSRTGVLLARRARFRLTLGSPRALADAKEAERLVTAGSPGARATVLDVLGSALISERRYDQAREALAEAGRLARAAGDGELQTAARITAGSALIHAGRYDEARAELDEARLRAERTRDVAALVRILAYLCLLHWGAGRYDEAAALAQAGAGAARDAGRAHTLGGHFVALHALVLTATGHWPEAVGRLESWLEHDPEGLFAAYPLAVRGDLAVACGDTATAVSCLARARAALGDGPDTRQGGLPVARLAAEIAVREGRIADARKVVAHSLHFTEMRGETTHAWRLLVTAARIEVHARAWSRTLPERAAGGDPTGALREAARTLAADTPPWHAYAAQFAAELDSLDAAGAAWPDVITLWEKAGDPYGASYARLRAAEAAVAAGDPSAAGEWLRHARRTAETLGAVPLREEIELLARRSRLRLDVPPDPPGTPRETAFERLGLTGREVEVLRLVADGCSNGRIAKTLFISPKTASVHVSRILAKLGVSSRGEAAAVAHRLRLFDDSG